ALPCELVQRGLHHLAHMGVHRVDVGVLAELLDHVDRVKHLRDNLARQGQVWWEEHTETERKAEADWEDLCSQSLESQTFRQPVPPGDEELHFLCAYRHHWHDRHTGLDRGPHVSGPTGE